MDIISTDSYDVVRGAKVVLKSMAFINFINKLLFILVDHEMNHLNIMFTSSEKQNLIHKNMTKIISGVLNSDRKIDRASWLSYLHQNILLKCT